MTGRRFSEGFTSIREPLKELFERTPPPDLTEESLEQAIADIAKFAEDTGQQISVRPTQMMLRMDLVQELAEKHGVSVDTMIGIIRDLVETAHREAQ